MKKPNLLIIFTLSLFIFAFIKSYSARAEQANYVVISEVQVSGSEESNADFIELYNPTSTEVDLSDMRLVKRTSSGAEDDNIVSFVDGDVIAPHGYFLWCNTLLNDSLNCDKNTSATISNNNSIGLREEPADTGNLIDALTFGEVDNPLGGGTALEDPEDDGSVERKACEGSTVESMTNGDSENGNSWDTNDNSSDFIQRTTSDPQNSSSPTEAPSCDGVTPTPTPTDDPSPTPTEEPTPTPTETVTPTPTETPAPTPTDEVTPTPTEEPTPTPTEEPTPSPTPTPEPEGQVIGRFGFPGAMVECRITWRVVVRGFFFGFFPEINCEKVTGSSAQPSNNSMFL